MRHRIGCRACTTLQKNRAYVAVFECFLMQSWYSDKNIFVSANLTYASVIRELSYLFERIDLRHLTKHPMSEGFGENLLFKSYVIVASFSRRS
jgi:hypothetical protein